MKTMILHNNISSIPVIVCKFKNLGIKEMIYWPNNRLSLVELAKNNTDNHRKPVPLTNSSKIFHEISETRFSHPIKLEIAMEIVKSNINFHEIDKNPKNLLNEMQKSRTISEQIERFFKFYSISSHDVKLRDCYRANIEKIVQFIAPRSSLVINGSTLSGLGRFNSDLDMKIVLPTEPNNQFDSVNILRKLKRALIVRHPHIRDPLVYDCQFPICHYFDDILQIYVDISIKPDDSPRMCRLLRTICDRFDYFAPLCTIVKQIYLHEDVLNDGTNIYFSGFKIVSLVIGFLQSRALLPPMKTLLADCPVPAQSQRPDLGDLLVDFFRYVIDFNPEMHEIDLYEGRHWPRSSDSFLFCSIFEDAASGGGARFNITRNIRKPQWDIFTRVNKKIVQSIESSETAQPHLWGVSRFIDFDERNA